MKNVFKLFGIIALAAVIGFSMAACGDGSGGDLDLSGNITVNPTTAAVGTELTATYSGSETVNYQWKKDSTNVGTNSDKYTPTEAGSYTVTVSAAGFKSKTSAAVTVTGGNSGTPDLTGNITISPSTNVNINTELTATYSGSETVNFQWKKSGTDVGTNSNKFTPTTAGSYTVTVSASGYNPKTSAVVDVNDPSLSPLSGTITISPSTGVIINTELTATYSGSETVNFQWEKDGSTIGTATTTNPNKYTPATAGTYTVTVSAAGYNSKTSNAVTVTSGGSGGGDGERRWKTWVSTLADGNYNSKSQVSITPTSDGTGCDVSVTGTANNNGNWASQVLYDYTAIAGKKYKVSWKWAANGKRFTNVTIRYAQQKDYQNDSAYELGTTTRKLTIPVMEETKDYEFTMPDNCIPHFTFKIGEDIGSFKIRDFKVVASNSGGGGDDVPPENKPVKDRWGKWINSSSTATLDYSVADDGVCTITVGGTAQPNNETDNWGRWRSQAQYAYTATAGKSYTYKFEAWTASGTRTLGVLYYANNDENDYKETTTSITSTRTTYTLNGVTIPKGGHQNVEFFCADQLGTFYVKILEIKVVASDSGSDGDYVPPENWPLADRWWTWVDPTSTASLVHSVDNNGVCTITVGDTAQPNNETDDWGRWKAEASFEHTATAGKSYTYKFEAWTQSGTRVVNFQYCTDGDNRIYKGETISLTTTRKTYTVNGQPLSKGAMNHVAFQCANQLGTFYVKILEIKEVGSSSGGDGLAGTTWVYGNDKITFYADKKVVYDMLLFKGITGTYTISGNRVTVHYKGTFSGINYDENWVYSLSGNTLTVESVTGNPTTIGKANIGFVLTKQQ